MNHDFVILINFLLMYYLRIFLEIRDPYFHNLASGFIQCVYPPH